jgi:hypothetical protein
MSRAGRSHNVVQFANPADEIFDLLERLVDASMRLQRLEQAQSLGDDILARIDKLEAQMKVMEQGRFKFPVALHVNKISKTDFPAFRAEGDRWVELSSEMHGLADQVRTLFIRQGDIRQAEVVRAHKRLDDDAATFNRMREAWRQMTARIEMVELRMAAINGDGETKGT